MLILTVEAAFGLLIVGIYSIGQNPFKEVIKYHEELDTGNFVLLIFLGQILPKSKYGKNGKKMNNQIYNIIKKFNLYKLNNKFI